MRQELEQFLTNWWHGLCAPFRDARPPYQILSWDSSNNELNTEALQSTASLNKPLYLKVSKQQVLSSKLDASQKHAATNIDSAVQNSLPFTPDEVYAVIDEQTLFAVLRSDVEKIKLAVAELGTQLDGLVFENAQTQVPLHFQSNSTNQPSSSNYLLEKTLGALVIVGLAITGALWHFSEKQQLNIAKLTASLTEIQSTPNIQIENFEPESASVAMVADALSAIKNTLDVSSNIGQISLQWTEDGLSVVLDADSKNAAALLSLFEQNQKFSRSEFVSAISSNKDNTSERFRLKTLFTTTENQTNIDTAAQNDGDTLP